MSTKPDQAQFRIGEPQGGHNFSVFDTFINTERRVVAFDLREKDFIRARKMNIQGEELYSLSLDAEGDCRLLLDSVHYQPWQVLQRALEPLFYDRWPVG